MCVCVCETFALKPGGSIPRSASNTRTYKLDSDLLRCQQSHHLAGLVHLRAILLASLLAFRADEAHGLDQRHATSWGGGQSRRVSAEISSSLDELRGARWTTEVSCRPLPRAPRRSRIPWWFDIRRERTL